jgi:hypothetical protein
MALLGAIHGTFYELRRPKSLYIDGVVQRRKKGRVQEDLRPTALTLFGGESFEDI